MTRQVEALIAGAYLAGTNTRRVKRALVALFDGAIGKDVVSRTWRKVRTDWEAWNQRDLAGEDVVRLILDGTVGRVRLDRKATNISLLVVRPRLYRNVAVRSCASGDCAARLWRRALTKRETAYSLRPLALEPVEVGSDHQRDRTAARGVRTPHQDQTVLPSAETAAMLFWALLASVRSPCAKSMDGKL